MLGFNGGRIGVANTVFTGTVSDDPNYSDVSLLLNGNGTNGSTTFTDSSSYGHTVTANGNAQISTTQSKFGGASMYFDGNGDYLTIPDSDQFEIGSGDFTFEAWIYLTGYSVAYQGQYYVAEIICKDSNTSSTGRGFTFEVRGTSTSWTTLGVSLFSSNSTLIGTSATTSFNLNTWYHVAAIRNGSSLRLYKDGVDVGGGTNAISVQNTATVVTVGSESPYYISLGYAYYFPGYIDDLRITKGVARYTSNFTPPTAQLPGTETRTFASGVWTPREQCDAVRREIWPGFVISIVTDGLVLHLDAGDSVSYPGSGTTWTDLSGNGNDGTLTNGPTYSSAYGGYLDFDGSDDYVDVGNLGIDFGSLGIWIYLESTITSSTSAMSLLKYNNNGQGGITFGSATSYASNETLTILQSDNNSGQDFQRTYIRDNINSGWNYIVIQWNGSKYDFYINAVSKTTYNGTGTPGAAEQETITNLQVANTYTNGGTNFNGRISQVAIYDRALTQSEITQNFDALKGRYGL